MKILLVDAGRSLRGGQRQAALLARGLLDRGHTVTAAIRTGSALGPVLERAGIEAHPIPLASDLDLYSGWRLGHLVRSSGAEIVHAHDARSHAVARLAQLCGSRVPLVVTRRLVRQPSGRFKYLRNVAAWIAISDCVRQSLLAAGIPPDRITVVRPGIAPRPQAAVAREYVVLVVSALSPEKDVALAIRAAARLSDDLRARWRWVIAGEGPEGGRLRDLARELEVPVTFTGHLPDPGPWYDRARLLVHPCSVEAAGTAVLDGLASGLPVIGIEGSGLGEYLSAEAGELVPAEPELLAAAVARWLGDPPRCDRAEAAARAVAAPFGLDSMVSRTESVYLGALHQDPGRTR